MQQLLDNRPNTYFQLFGVDESFDLDLQHVSNRYRELQSETHPDRFAGADESLKLKAVQLTSYINQAYETLTSPLKRAAYLMQLRGHDPEQVSQSDLSAGLLMEQMQLREVLEEMPDDESALLQLEQLKMDVSGRLSNKESEFSSRINEDDISAARRSFHELQFLHKLLIEIEASEEARLGY